MQSSPPAFHIWQCSGLWQVSAPSVLRRGGWRSTCIWCQLLVLEGREGPWALLPEGLLLGSFLKVKITWVKQGHEEFSGWTGRWSQSAIEICWGRGRRRRTSSMLESAELKLALLAGHGGYFSLLSAALKRCHDHNNLKGKVSVIFTG